MQDLYFTPITTIIILISLIIIVLTLSIYYMYSGVIHSIHKFSLIVNLSVVKNLLVNTNYYDYWWPKFTNFYIYKTKIEQACDSTLQNARITLKIHSNSSKETWEILLEQKQNNIVNITVTQELDLQSKASRICRNSLSYKKDLLLFQKALQKALVLSNKAAL